MRSRSTETHCAQGRKIAATRLAEGGVLEVSRPDGMDLAQTPAGDLVIGASVVQEAKWCSLGRRLISV